MSTDVAQADVVQPANGDTEQVSFQLQRRESSKVSQMIGAPFDSHVRC